VETIPGVWLATDEPSGVAPRLTVRGEGVLATRAAGGGWTCVADGLLAGARGGAADVLAAFLARGRDALRDLVTAGGQFAVVLARDDGQEALALTDAMTTRPLYLWHADGRSFLAPAPSAFVTLGLPMTLDRTTMVEVLELLHPVSGQTLAREVTRVRPGQLLRLAPGAPPVAEVLVRFVVPPEPDPPRDLEVWADRLTTIVRDGLELALGDPRLAGKPVHLPLTAGLDSRHLLGELLRLGRAPAVLHHVVLERRDYTPVVGMADALGLRLHALDVAAVDHRRAVGRWIARCAGAVNLHQWYLFALLEELAPGVPGQAVGFDGLGMDRLLGVQFVLDLPAGEDPIARLFTKAYTRPRWLLRLVPDAAARRAEAMERMRAVLAQIDGPPWYQMTLADTFSRLVYHSGGAVAAHGDEAIYVAPGADWRALELFLRAPRDLVGLKAARLDALRRHFPELAAFPGEDGVPVAQRTTLRRARKRRGLFARRLFGWALRGFRGDRAPETEHAWMRQIPFWRRACTALARTSALEADGVVPPGVLAALWRKHRRGAFLGWPLFSLLTVELSHRHLVRQEPIDHVLDWMESR